MANNAPCNESNESFNFTGFPREIRDRVYEELLWTERTLLRRATWCLEPSILRTSKQVHAEAKLILYQRNCWILCSIDRWLYNHMVLSRMAHLSSTFINALPGPAALQMSIFNQRSTKTDTITCLITVKGAHQFCQFVTAECYSRKCMIMLAFNEALRSKPYVLETLFDAFQDVRCMQFAVITGVLPQSRVTQLRDSMTGPLSTPAEVEQRTKVYLARGEHLISKDRYFDAQRCVHNGFEYIRSSCYSRTELMVGDLQENPLASLATHLLMRRAFCIYKLGAYRSAYRLARHQDRYKNLFQHTLAGKTAAAFYLGLACIKESKVNLAVLAFTKVLHLEPGHIAVDKELDTLENKIKNMPFSEDRHKAIHNMALAEEIFRHKQPGHQEIRAGLAKNYFRHFMFRLSRKPQKKPPENEDSAGIRFLCSLERGSDACEKVTMPCPWWLERSGSH